MEKTILKVAIHRELENPVFDRGVIHVSLEDEAGGAFIKIEEMTDSTNNNSISIEREMIKPLFNACEELIRQKHARND